METGSEGTFVISWSQTETDGLKAAPLDILSVGVAWRWSGVPVRLDAPQAVLLLERAEGADELRRRAARMVRRLVGTAIGQHPPEKDSDLDPDCPEQSFIVTDGHCSYTLTLIPVPDTGALLVMVMGDMPPPETDLWVMRMAMDRSALATSGQRSAGGVICFTPDTMLDTPDGPRAIATLRPGDRVLTRDNGPQEILWTGQRRMSGARLHAMPWLRPIRLRSGALGKGRPEPDLVVSPQHRMLIKGATAEALFNAPEVLVAAEDLVNDRSILVDHALREVTYVHVLLDRHNVIWANGLETESFHPANAALDTIDPVQRDGLLAVFPDIAGNPQSYGDYARRNLSTSEAAILRFDMKL